MKVGVECIFNLDTTNGRYMKGESAGATDFKRARKMVSTCSVAMIYK